MNFAWPHFLGLAKNLIAISKDPSLEEAYFRTSVSRAYYSVFGVASEILNEVGGKYAVPSRSTHEHVRNTFSEGDTRIQKNIGTTLQRLWHQRKQADYVDSKKYTCNKKESEIAVDRAERILSLLGDPNARKFR